MRQDPPSATEIAGFDGAHWRPNVSYGEYLELDALLACQRRRSAEHDELLFIIIHQASELWLKLALFEVEAAIAAVASGETPAALKMLARVVRIQAQLTHSWSILATLTPAEYCRFRDHLGQSSGFQSRQYRQLEFRLGNKKASTLHVHTEQDHERLATALKEPSLYDVVLKRLHVAGFPIPLEVVERDWSQPYAPHPAVRLCWVEIYRAPERHWAFYELAEKLLDVEQAFQRWRFDHLTTVERIIGAKRGTGGTSGVAYLARALELRFFPELWALRNEL